MGHTTKIAMIGVGAISGIYLQNITHTFRELELVGVCDLIPERAQKGVDYVKGEIEKGAKVRVPKIYKDMYEAFDDPEVELVLNITRPYEHFDVTKQALLHGKHVYSEKPLAVDMEEATELVALAKKQGLQLGGAPDTFMGAGIQTARQVIDSGMIGDPLGATCAMVCHGHETWHPDPEFYYKRGGGPMLDMGPYYVTALINLLGGVKGLMGRTKRTFEHRTITSAPKRGTDISVDVPTYVTGILDFDCGAVGTIFTTFDVYNQGQARLEIYGTKGTLICPDPNTFGGPIKLLRPEQGELMDMPLLFDYKENSRALGLADMAKALTDGRDFRASYKQTLHALEIMTGFEKASEQNRYIELTTHYERSAPMANNPIHGILD